jgi:hypothetical protein
LTSNKTLGRNIYTFSATATEVLEPSTDNYNDFFSSKKTDLDYILANVYVYALRRNEEAISVLAEDIVPLVEEEPLVFEEVISKIQYAVVRYPSFDMDSHWIDAENVDKNTICYTSSGQAVKPTQVSENKYMFTADRMPMIRTIETSRKIVQYETEAINLYYQPYGLNI